MNRYKNEITIIYHYCDEDLLDVGCNADLCVANHEVDLIYEDQVRDISSILNEPCQDFVQFRS